MIAQQDRLGRHAKSRQQRTERCQCAPGPTICLLCRPTATGDTVGAREPRRLAV
jgi:hypothetical protein